MSEEAKEGDLIVVEVVAVGGSSNGYSSSTQGKRFDNGETTNETMFEHGLRGGRS